MIVCGNFMGIILILERWIKREKNGIKREREKL